MNRPTSQPGEARALTDRAIRVIQEAWRTPQAPEVYPPGTSLPSRRYPNQYRPPFFRRRK